MFKSHIGTWFSILAPLHLRNCYRRFQLTLNWLELKSRLGLVLTDLRLDLVFSDSSPTLDILEWLDTWLVLTRSNPVFCRHQRKQRSPCSGGCRRVWGSRYFVRVRWMAKKKWKMCFGDRERKGLEGSGNIQQTVLKRLQKCVDRRWISRGGAALTVARSSCHTAQINPLHPNSQKSHSHRFGIKYFSTRIAVWAFTRHLLNVRCSLKCPPLQDVTSTSTFTQPIGPLHFPYLYRTDTGILSR